LQGRHETGTRRSCLRGAHADDNGPIVSGTVSGAQGVWASTVVASIT
jgi:hypothetical protein